MRFLLPFLLLLLSIGSAYTQHDPSCPVTDVRFPKGTSGTIASGMASWDDILCFDQGARAGQQVTMRVLEGSNTIFSVYGTTDARNDVSLVAPSSQVQFLVSQLLRAPGPERFRLQIDVQ